jgi:hypothetical protein
MLQASLVVEIPSDRLETVASRNHTRWSSEAKEPKICFQFVAIRIICYKIEAPGLLKIMLLWHFQTDQHKADTPVHMLALVILSMPFSQFPNMFLIFVGGEILLVK